MPKGWTGRAVSQPSRSPVARSPSYTNAHAQDRCQGWETPQWETTRPGAHVALPVPGWHLERSRESPGENPERLTSYPNRLFKTERRQEDTFICQDQVFSSIIRNNKSKMRPVIENRAVNIFCTSESLFKFRPHYMGFMEACRGVAALPRSRDAACFLGYHVRKWNLVRYQSTTKWRNTRKKIVS